MSESVFLAVSTSEWVAANHLAFAIWDAFPVTPGHVLIVTKRVVVGWFEATEEERSAILDLLDPARAAIERRHSPDGYNVGWNAGSAAGQTVDHLHVHVIPRYTGDVADPRGGVRHVIPDRANYLVDGDACGG